MIEAISIIGVMTGGGQWDATGNELVAPVVIPGFHVNALGEIPLSWAPYVVQPASPVRIFGGDES